MYHDISDLLKGGVREWTFCGVLSKEEIERLGSAASASRAQAILDRCAELGYSVLTIDDPAYPHCLMHLYAPPAVLYVHGTLPDFEHRLSIGVVGTRSASRYGLANSYKFAYALAKYETVIISGSMRPLSSAAALSA